MNSVTADLFTALGLLSFCGLGLGILGVLAYQIHGMRSEIISLTQQQAHMAEMSVINARLSALPRIYHIRVEKKKAATTIAALVAGSIWEYYREESHDGIVDLYFKRQS